MSSGFFCHVDTTILPFQDVEGDPGSKRQLLLQDPQSGGVIEIEYVPPGFSDNVAEMLRHGAHRHYHRSVNERHYVLNGDYPVWHWSDLKGEGALTVLRRHSYLENPPLTVHGVKPETRPQTGALLLVWNNGPGTGIFEPEAAVETVTLPTDSDASQLKINAPRLVMTEMMPWLPHPTIQGWKVKPIAPEVAGSPAVGLVHIPAAWRDDGASIEGGAKKWMFLLSGDLKLEASSMNEAQNLALREGHFLAWSQEATIRISPGECSQGSCTALCVGLAFTTSIPAREGSPVRRVQ